MLTLAVQREKLKELYSMPSEPDSFFRSPEELFVQQLEFPEDGAFPYAIWGVCLPGSYNLHDALQKRFKNAKMVCAIDTFATGEYKDNIPIISPKELDEKLDKNTVVFVAAPAARQDAKDRLHGKYTYFILQTTTI